MNATAQQDQQSSEAPTAHAASLRKFHRLRLQAKSAHAALLWLTGERLHMRDKIAAARRHLDTLRAHRFASLDRQEVIDQHHRRVTQQEALIGDLQIALQAVEAALAVERAEFEEMPAVVDGLRQYLVRTRVVQPGALDDH